MAREQPLPEIERCLDGHTEALVVRLGIVSVLMRGAVMTALLFTQVH